MNTEDEKDNIIETEELTSDGTTMSLKPRPVSEVLGGQGSLHDSYTTKRMGEPIAISLENIASSLRGMAEALVNNKKLLTLLDLLNGIEALVKEVATIQATAGEHKDFCLGCISALLKRTVNQTAAELTKFNKDNFCELKFEHTAAAFSSVPLSEHMKRLDKGGRYDVVSDLASWRDNQLAEFRTQTELAVKKGVRVRRVFNLMLKPRYRTLDPMVQQNILEQHYDDAEIWNAKYTGKYEVSFFDELDLERLQNEVPGVVYDEYGISAHFGIFSQGTEGQMLVEYEVREPDVSTMTLRTDGIKIRNHLDGFEAIWKIAPKLTKELIQALKNR